MDVIENSAYHRLLLFYKGELQESALTGKGVDAVIYAYGLANRELWSGAHDKAKSDIKRIVEKKMDDWPTFAYIAAEADLVRIRRRDHKHKKHRKKKNRLRALHSATARASRSTGCASGRCRSR